MTTHLLSVPVLAAVLALTQCQHMVPCDGHQGSDTDPPLPVLPDQFRVHVEANIVQKKLTRNIVEYYDYKNNRAMIEGHDHTTSEYVRTVINFNTQEARRIYENGTCEFMLTNSTSRHFMFLSANNGSHIKTVKDLLYFGDQMGEKFINGNKTVRGIPVNHWQACVRLPIANGTFTLDYYFTKGSDYVVDGLEVQLPVRAVINGSGHAMNYKNKTMSPELHTFYHIYEFTDFHPGPIKDTSVFEIPVGTYCHSDVNRKPTPKLPEQFSVGVEVASSFSFGGYPRLMNQQMYYDAVAMVTRVDVDELPMLKDRERYGGKRPLSLIHDKANGLRYIIDRWEGNCSVVPDSWPIEGLALPEEKLAIFDESFLYQGQKTLRGIKAESWANFNKSTNTITEVILQQQQPSDGAPPRGGPGHRQRRVPAPGRGAYAPYVPVGIYVRFFPTETRPEEVAQYNMYGFTSTHPDPAVFDISQCYEVKHQYAYMSLNVAATYETDVQYNRREFTTSVRSAIARGAGVSVMRVTAIELESDTKTANNVRVWFKLLDRPASGTHKLASLAAAKLNLASSVAGGLNFDVQYPTIEKNFEVVRDTLWDTKSMYMDHDSEPVKKYSSSAMAGLGIGMVVIGALLGLVVAYVIYKRVDMSIPYEVTN